MYPGREFPTAEPNWLTKDSPKNHGTLHHWENPCIKPGFRVVDFDGKITRLKEAGNRD